MFLHYFIIYGAEKRKNCVCIFITPGKKISSGVIKMTFKSKRMKVRIISFVCAVTLSLFVWGYSEKAKADSYENQINLSYQQALSSLSSYLDTIKTDLYKGLYASTPAMTGKLSASLCQASAGALESVSRLPGSQNKLYNAYKFLTQVGAFTDSLSKKSAEGENISEEEYGNMEQLYKYASALSGQLSYAEEMMISSELSFDDSVSTLSLSSPDDSNSMNFSDAVDETEKSFSDFPTLIYDGPFSDSLTDRSSVFLADRSEISQSSAAKRAADILSVDEKEIKFSSETSDALGSYVFICGNRTVAITKAGGFLRYILSDGYASESVMNKDDAVKAGDEFLKKCGYTDMQDTYYAENDGICTVNYAYETNSVICYTDLIKVSISLSDGSITGFDASGYLTNHKERAFPSGAVTIQDAAKSLSSRLTPVSVKKAIIPTDGESEKSAYEFKCTTPDSADVLVYIDAETRQEDEILILLYSDGGVLTK